MTREWTTEEIDNLARSYQAASILCAAADLELFDALAGGAQTAEEVATTLEANPRGTTVLLDALVALSLLSKSDDRYAPAPGVGEHLSKGGENCLLATAQLQGSCLRRWSRLSVAVKTGTRVERPPGVRGEEGDYASFVGAMSEISKPLAAQVLADIGPLEFKRVLDVGGALGAWSQALLRTRPGTTAILFDLPHVIPQAERNVAAAGLSERFIFVAGDFASDPLPTGADLVWLSAIIHQNSREQNRRLFAAIFAALPPGGHLLIRDVLMDAARTTPFYGALFAVNMLVATEGGGTFTFEEVQEDLLSAGFENAAVRRRDREMSAVVSAEKPNSA